MTVVSPAVSEWTGLALISFWVVLPVLSVGIVVAVEVLDLQLKGVCGIEEAAR